MRHICGCLMLLRLPPQVPEYAALQPRLAQLQDLVRQKARTASCLLAYQPNAKGTSARFLVRWADCARADDSWEDAALPFDPVLKEALARRCAKARVTRWTCRFRRAFMLVPTKVPHAAMAFRDVKPGASAASAAPLRDAQGSGGGGGGGLEALKQAAWLGGIDDDDQQYDDLRALNYEFEAVSPAASAPKVEPLSKAIAPPGGWPGGAATVYVSKGSVLSFTGAAIVNAASNGCIGGAGVDGAVNEAGGRALRQARKALPIVRSPLIRCETGDAKLTISGALLCRYVIHAVGPNYHHASSAEDAALADALLYSAYRSAMRLARLKDLPDLAFSLISSGIYGGARTHASGARPTHSCFAAAATHVAAAHVAAALT